MIRAIILALLLAGTTIGQEHSVVIVKGPSLSSAVVLKHVRSDASGNRTLFATANHNFHKNSPSEYRIEFRDGRTTSIELAIADNEHDVALVWGWSPPSLKPIIVGDSKSIPELSASHQPTKLQARLLGFASNSFVERTGPVSFRDNGFVVADAVTSPGMSGGAMIVNGKLVGMISQGRLTDSNDPNVVWPAMCAEADLITKLMEQAISERKQP